MPKLAYIILVIKLLIACWPFTQTFFVLIRVVAPKQEKLELATASLLEKQRMLAEAQAKLKELQDMLAKLQQEYEEKLQQKEELNKKVKDAK